MKLLATELIEINKGIPDIHVELEWDHGEGEYIETDQEIYTNGFIVVFGIMVKGSAQKLVNNDFMEENTYSQPKYTTVIENLRVYDEDGEKLTMLDKHNESIRYNLHQNVYKS
jgi:hypothetical protein